MRDLLGMQRAFVVRYSEHRFCGPALSCPVIWSFIFRSCIFSPPPDNAIGLVAQCELSEYDNPAVARCYVNMPTCAAIDNIVEINILRVAARRFMCK